METGPTVKTHGSGNINSETRSTGRRDGLGTRHNSAKSRAASCLPKPEQPGVEMTVIPGLSSGVSARLAGGQSRTGHRQPPPAGRGGHGNSEANERGPERWVTAQGSAPSHPRQRGGHHTRSWASSACRTRPHRPPARQQLHWVL